MISLTTPAQNARLLGLADLIDSGVGTSAIRLYAGSRPPLGDPPNGAMLVSVDLPVPCAAVAAGVLTFDTAAWVNVAASGTIVWGRIVDRAGGVVADLDAGLTGSGAAIELNTLTVFAGGLLAVTSALLRE